MHEPDANNEGTGEQPGTGFGVEAQAHQKSKFIFLKGLVLSGFDRLEPPLANVSQRCSTIRFLCSRVPENRFLQDS